MNQPTDSQTTGASGLMAQLENPYPLYAALRQQEKVIFSPEVNAWVVARYEDVRSILAQPDIFSSANLIPSLPLSPAAMDILMKGYPIVAVAMNSDGVNHQRFRGAHATGFSGPGIKKQEQMIRGIANRLVDSFIDDGHAEFVGQFAAPLSLETILKLLGVPQDRMVEVKQWGQDMIDLLFSEMASEERQIVCVKGFVAFQKYVAELINERRVHPQNDEIDRLLAYGSPDSPAFSEVELISAVTGLLTAGQRSTVDVNSNGLVLLLQEPSRWQTLCERPDLIPSAVEEILRYDTSAQTLIRTTTSEVEVGGVTLPEGARLLLIVGSANRDEQQFPNSDGFDITRSPNRHLSFGHGVHYCLGAHAARLKMRITLETLTQRIPGLRLAPNQQFVHNPLLMFRGYQKFYVEW